MGNLPNNLRDVGEWIVARQLAGPNDHARAAAMWATAFEISRRREVLSWGGCCHWF
jgi:hypothetical protein